MKIDIDKFICDLIDVETDHRITVTECCRVVSLSPLAMSICDALQKQGLEVVNGTLREIKGNDGGISLNEETTESLPEEPVSNDLEEAAKSYGDEKEKKAGCGTEFTTDELVKSFKVGAKWMLQHIEDYIKVLKENQNKKEE